MASAVLLPNGVESKCMDIQLANSDTILHSHHRDNLKSYIIYIYLFNYFIYLFVYFHFTVVLSIKHILN
jgi:hypothetical protein